jgi:type IV pilus assembly protein PilV
MPRGQMEMTRQTYPLHTQRGTTLLEVLITIVILAIGLLGLAGLQARLQSSEMEAYQRSQALILLNDMASRIATNRANAANYVTGAGDPLALGERYDCPTHTDTHKSRCQRMVQRPARCGRNAGWKQRRRHGWWAWLCRRPWCCNRISDNRCLARADAYIRPSCQCCLRPNDYDGEAGSACTGDLCRRTVTTIVRIGNLSS